MLTDSQKLTIKVAVRRARGNGTEAEEIRKLASGMGVGEGEIRAYAEQALGPAPVSRAGLENPPSAPAGEAAKKPAGKRRGKRLVWTDEMVRRMLELSAQGMGPVAIADEMGLKVRQVKMKLYNHRKRSVSSPTAREAAVSEAAAPVRPAAEPSPADLPAQDPGPKQGLNGRSEYDVLRAKLAEPEVPGINLAKELLDLMDHFELAYNAKPVLLQAAPSAEWAARSFDADGRRYFVNLRAKRREAAS